MEWLKLEAWSPYIVGAGIGVLSWLAFLLSDKPIGCSTAFARTSGMLERLLRGDRVLQKSYYRKLPPEIDWEWMLVSGVVIGAFLSAFLSGQLWFEWVPDHWLGVFGPAVSQRLALAFIGGVFMGIGSQIGRAHV